MILLILLNLAFSYPVPEYMKDAVITVTTKDGKVHTFSGNTHKVVTRHRETRTRVSLGEFLTSVKRIENSKKHKHILSGELVHSMKRMKTEKRPEYMKAETEFDLGLGLQYQYRFHDDMFIGGRFDTNGGTAINLGLGLK